MEFRDLYLVTFHTSPNQSKHFAIFVPNTNDHQKGTLIHVVGTPATGYRLEFERNYNPLTCKSFQTINPIGKIATHRVVDPQTAQASKDNAPRGKLEVIASQIPPPLARNFIAPFGGVIRRCQEWTMDFVTKLVAKGYINGQARVILKSHSDPINYGIDMQAAGRGGYGGGTARGGFGRVLRRGM